MSARLRRWRQGAILTTLAAILGIWVLASGTLSGFSLAKLSNTAGSSGTGLLALTHSYPTRTPPPASATCTSFVTPAPSAVVCGGALLPATAAATQSDTITNNGTLAPAQITATVGLASCAPRQLANTRGASNPLLPRHATALNWRTGPSGTAAAANNPLPGSGSVSFTAASQDYASNVTAVAPPLTNALVSSSGGFGLWFKTTAAGGGLVSFDSVAQVPAAATGDNTLALYLSGGHVGFRRNATTSIGTSSGSYNDGKWHFAYVAMHTNLLGVTTSLSVYVDSASTPVISVSGLGLTVSLPSTGYWLLGWSQSDGYLTGSEADFVTFDSNAAATGSSLYGASSQTAFESTASAAGAQLLWPLADQGNSPYTGGYPIFGSSSASNPCAMVTGSWNGSSARTLTALTSTPIATTVPAAGASAGYGLTLAHTASYATNYVSGLQMYAPAVYSVGATASPSWTTTFTWAQSGTLAPDTNPNAPPTFVM